MSATVFDTPLDRRSLVEASAGTGKTYALAGLFARAVIVERLQVPQILAVTYTVAATQELHERVRLRLQRATQLAAQWPSDGAAERDGDDAETALLRRLLHTALHDTARESLPALHLRLQRAVRDLDLAAITTIHGFCQRLLAEHALLAGQPLLGVDIEPGNAAQRHRLAVAAWRETARSAEGADFLQRSFGSLDALASAMRDLLAPEPLLPLPPDGNACLAHAEAWRALRQVFRDEGTASREALRVAVSTRVLSAAKDKVIPLETLWAWFDAQSDAPPRSHEALSKLTRAYLRKACLKNMEGREPDLALCDAVQRFLAAEEACDLQRMHALRAGIRANDRVTKRAAQVRDFDDLVEDVFVATADPVAGPALAAAARAQYPLALVDEFQDTDARQWAIFARLFGEGGLLLVGDPKQAIYRFRGGDVQTYLDARGTAQLAVPLDRNFRSRPCLIAVANALFERATAADPALLGDGIAFAAILAGGAARDDDCTIDGEPAPALVVQRVPPKPDCRTGEWTKSESIALAARCCALEIRDRLRSAHVSGQQRRDGGRHRPLQPRDFAVLVRTHEEGIAIRDELTRLGVPAVSAGRGSLFDTDEAQQLLSLLLALSAPGDERRLRAVLATALFGYDAAALQALEDDGDAQRHWQQDLADWRLRWETHGPQPMLAEVLAREATRLLGFAGGERQLTHLSQLAELLQEARASRLGPQGQVDWLRSAIAHADRDDETQQPRLESDASRVQILTLHKSKGLEFPLVFLPFAAIGRGNGKQARFVGYHDPAGVRVRQWKTQQSHAGAPSWDEACAASKREDAAEDMRLLYVGLTRARDALWVCTGPFASHAGSALHRLFGGPVPDPVVVDGAERWIEVREDLPELTDRRRLAADLPEHVPPAREPHRRLRRDWWIHSFSQLHRQQAHGAQALADDAPADDERPLAIVDAGLVPPSRFGGTRFGNALHYALEHVEFAAWAGVGDVPASQVEHLRAALRFQDYPDSDLDDGVRELAPLIARTLNAPLPGGGRLCDVVDSDRIAELEFHFSLADADAHAFLALLQSRAIALGRRDFGAWPRLAGLMTGKIDLTYRVDGRVYVVDYKSNRLPGYDDEALTRAMSASEYDLQALLYVIAVHRWLRLRLGDGYDFSRHFGGVRYLFCRGLDPDRPGVGIARPEFPGPFVEAADALLAGRGVAS